MKENTSLYFCIGETRRRDKARRLEKKRERKKERKTATREELFGKCCELANKN